MIEKKPTARDDVLEFHVSGIVSEKDYTMVLIPALEGAIETQDRLRLLVRFSADFEDYTLGALLQDARTGLKHWRGFDRIAIVADQGWIAKAAKAMSVIMPCPVMVFTLAEHEDAQRWLTESLGSIHQRELGGGVLHVQLLGQLDAASFAEEAEDLNAFLRANDRFRLLLDLREFDGWQGLGAVAEHVAIVRDHAAQVQRVAILGDGGIAQFARRVAPRFVHAEVKHFGSEEVEAAKSWLAAA